MSQSYILGLSEYFTKAAVYRPSTEVISIYFLSEEAEEEAEMDPNSVPN